MSQWPKQNDVNSFYGNCQGKNGQSSPTWEKAHLVLVKAPWPLVTSWEPRATVKGVRVHAKCATSLGKVFDAIWAGAGQDPAKIEEWGMDLFGGGYTFRIMKGGSHLSMHSWGCAVDFDPLRNGLGNRKPNFGKCPVVLDAFAAEGWTWGGEWSKPDGMHWQAADV